MEYCPGLEKLFRTCDAVTVGLPLTEETRDRIDEHVLKEAKPGLLLVNTCLLYTSRCV